MVVQAEIKYRNVWKQVLVLEKKMPKDLFSVHALFKSSLDFCGTNTRVFSIIVTACVYSGKIRKAVEVVFCNQWLEFPSTGKLNRLEAS